MSRTRRFALARLLQSVAVVAVVVTLAFTLEHLAPGDALSAIDDPQLTAAQRNALRVSWGEDQPLWRQYGRWVVNFATGDFGYSRSQSDYVATVLRTVVPRTLLLMVPAVVLGWLAGVALGTWQAVSRKRFLARVSGVATLTLISVPDFIFAILVFSLFASHWRLAPTAGMFDVVHHDDMPLAGRIGDVLAHMVLPVATLATLIAAAISRYQRTATLDVLHEDYLRTARAKGAPERRIVLHHVLRNSLGPVIAIAGLLLPAVFAGTVFVERIFGWPGMGLALVNAVGRRDYALVQGIVVVGTVVVVLSALLADLAAAAINPRVTLEA